MTTKYIPLSVLRGFVRRAHFVARYVQGTMGLEGQGVSREFVRRMVRDGFNEMVADYRSMGSIPTSASLLNTTREQNNGV